MNSMSRMSSYADDAADRVNSFADGAKSAAEDVRGRASDAIRKGTDWASSKTGDLDGSTRQLVAAMSDVVNARPLVAVGVAVVTGFLLYHLFSRD